MTAWGMGDKAPEPNSLPGVSLKSRDFRCFWFLVCGFQKSQAFIEKPDWTRAFSLATDLSAAAKFLLLDPEAMRVA